MTLTNLTDGVGGPDFDIIALEEVMLRLAGEDPRAAQVAEMRLFGALHHGEIAEALGVSERTVAGDWAFARRFLARELG